MTFKILAYVGKVMAVLLSRWGKAEERRPGGAFAFWDLCLV